MNINEIATAAARRTPSKAADKDETIKILRDLMEQDTERGADFWAPVYRFMVGNFPQGASAAKKDPAAWAWLAVGVKDVRYYLNSAYSDGARFMATDGHRLHIAKDVIRPAGWYDKAGERLTLADEEIWKYPDVDRILPALDKCATYTAILSELEAVEVPGHAKNGRKWLGVNLPCGRRVNRGYLVDALTGHPAGDNGAFTYHAAPDCEDTPIRIDYADRVAVIMPMRK